MVKIYIIHLSSEVIQFRIAQPSVEVATHNHNQRPSSISPTPIATSPEPHTQPAYANPAPWRHSPFQNAMAPVIIENRANKSKIQHPMDMGPPPGPPVLGEVTVTLVEAVVAEQPDGTLTVTVAANVPAFAYVCDVLEVGVSAVAPSPKFQW